MYSSHECASYKDLRMGLLFKFGGAVPEIFHFSCLKKRGIFGLLGGNYRGILRNGTAPD